MFRYTRFFFYKKPVYKKQSTRTLKKYETFRTRKILFPLTKKPFF